MSEASATLARRLAMRSHARHNRRVARKVAAQDQRIHEKPDQAFKLRPRAPGSM